MDDKLVGAVQACGYLPFNSMILSDHRGLYVDVDTNWFFGLDILPPQPMALRDYTAKNFHQMAIFIMHQAHHLKDHGWFRQVKNLQQCIEQNKPNHTLVEKVDHRRINACQYSRNPLKRYGPILYSPELMRMKTVIKLMSIIIQRMHYRPDEDEESTHDL
jgi:hypothetical protein